MVQNVSVKQAGKHIPDSKKVLIIADLTAGNSIRQVAADHGVAKLTVTRVSKMLKERASQIRPAENKGYTVRMVDDVSGTLRAIGGNCLLSMLHASNRLASMDLTDASSIALRAHVSATRDLIETVKPFVMTVDPGVALAAGGGEPVESDGPGEGEGVGESS